MVIYYHVNGEKMLSLRSKATMKILDSGDIFKSIAVQISGHCEPAAGGRSNLFDVKEIAASAFGFLARTYGDFI